MISILLSVDKIVIFSRGIVESRLSLNDTYSDFRHTLHPGLIRVGQSKLSKKSRFLDDIMRY